MDLTQRRAVVIYICWSCGDDFDVAEQDGLPDDPEVTCPFCGSDLVAVDFAAVRSCPRRSRAAGPSHAAPAAGSRVDERVGRRSLDNDVLLINRQ
jgi:DNA-directed RNA polymerase subunit RPC12/RpoP